MKNQSKQEIGLRILAGIGALVLLIGAVWLGVLVVQNTPSLFSNLAATFTTTQDDNEDLGILFVDVSPTVVVSGDEVTILWESNDIDPETSGTFVLSYECVEGIRFQTPDDNNTLLCSIPLVLEADTTETILIAESSLEEPADVEMSVRFTPEDTTLPQVIGQTTVTITPEEDQPENTNDSQISGTQTQTRRIPITVPVPEDPNGLPDFAVTILEFGTVDDDGNFTAQDVVDVDDTIAIKFEVKNIGTKSSGRWSFDAFIESGRDDEDFTSRSQKSLFPQGSIEFIIGFEDVIDDDDEGEALFEVDVDARDHIDELDEGNNRADITIPLED